MAHSHLPKDEASNSQGMVTWGMGLLGEHGTGWVPGTVLIALWVLLHSVLTAAL